MEGIEKRLIVFKEKRVRPSVFAVYIDTGKQRILALEVAFSIEEAQQMASKKITEDGTQQANWVMLTTYMAGDQLLKDMTEVKIIKVKKAKTKNELMKQIVKGEKSLHDDEAVELSKEDRDFLKGLIERKK